MIISTDNKIVREEFIGFKVDVRTRERLELACALSRRSKSSVARSAIETYIAGLLQAAAAKEAAAAAAAQAEISTVAPTKSEA